MMIKTLNVVFTVLYLIASCYCQEVQNDDGIETICTYSDSDCTELLSCNNNAQANTCAPVQPAGFGQYLKLPNDQFEVLFYMDAACATPPLFTVNAILNQCAMVEVNLGPALQITQFLKITDPVQATANANETEGVTSLTTTTTNLMTASDTVLLLPTPTSTITTSQASVQPTVPNVPRETTENTSTTINQGLQLQCYIFTLILLWEMH